MIDGTLSGTGSSNSSSQPRIGSDSCPPCQSGTWPDPNNQRLVKNIFKLLTFFLFLSDVHHVLVLLLELVRQQEVSHAVRLMEPT